MIQRRQLNKVTTIERHFIDSQKKIPHATGALSKLLSDIALASKIITREVRKAGLVNILGETGEKNVQGEEVQKLDIYANIKLIQILEQGGQTCVMASEENEEPVLARQGFPVGKYVICFDPLDGSSNIDVNVSIGTIFSIYLRKNPESDEPGTIEDILRVGSEQVAAGYVIYGSSTMFVYSTGDGVHGFTLDPSIGEYLLSNENIKIPEKGKIYSINEGNSAEFEDGVLRYMTYLKETDKDTNRPHSSRYTG